MTTLEQLEQTQGTINEAKERAKVIRAELEEVSAAFKERIARGETVFTGKEVLALRKRQRELNADLDDVQNALTEYEAVVRSLQAEALPDRMAALTPVLDGINQSALETMDRLFEHLRGVLSEMRNLKALHTEHENAIKNQYTRYEIAAHGRSSFSPVPKAHRFPVLLGRLIQFVTQRVASFSQGTGVCTTELEEIFADKQLGREVAAQRQKAANQ